jgi:putative two-component system response regulator
VFDARLFASLRVTRKGKNREKKCFGVMLATANGFITISNKEKGAIIMGTLTKHRIVLVDDNMTTLLMGKALMRNKYDVSTASSASELFGILQTIRPDMILLDVEMPVMNGYETLRALKNNLSTTEIPVIFVTGNTDAGSELQGLELGAVDYIPKPFSAPLLLKRVENHLRIADQSRSLHYLNENLQNEVNKKTREVVNLQGSMIVAITEMIESRDGTTGGHIERTQAYLKYLVHELQRMGVYRREMSHLNAEMLIASAPLHDTGKIAIEDCILNKPGKLTFEEFEKMKKHVDFGVEAIDRIIKSAPNQPFLQYAKVIAATHHEKWDGSGYPKGLAGPDIPLEGRLMAIADVYDALISERPYKQACTCTEANRIIDEGSGSHFDPALVEVFHGVSNIFASISQSYNKKRAYRIPLNAA